jgi:hypothetical protein
MKRNHRVVWEKTTNFFPDLQVLPTNISTSVFNFIHDGGAIDLWAWGLPFVEYTKARENNISVDPRVTCVFGKGSVVQQLIDTKHYLFYTGAYWSTIGLPGKQIVKATVPKQADAKNLSPLMVENLNSQGIYPTRISRVDYANFYGYVDVQRVNFALGKVDEEDFQCAFYQVQPTNGNYYTVIVGYFDL